ncbi:hypothetical protein DPMN_057331 [Dreissena polymorpha]|uniref:Uncharacterized protein n=1 Tax=Dreissena polymorpha TaxID=45954 RepID=A0A9D4BZT2_DREPO|nr:hypothetical protein DPMN_057331 [Dreissena polymorpha]
MFFLLIRTIFELNCRIKETNVLTKFHKDWAKNVSYRLFTCFHYIHIEKTAPPPGGHVFQMFTTIFSRIRDIHITNAKNVTSRVKNHSPPGGHETNVLTKFQDDWTKHVTSRVFTCFHYIHIEKTAPPLGGHAKIVTSRVFTRNTAPPPGGHVFQQTGTIFELNKHIIKTNILTNFELSRGIIGTNVLTKFHEDRTRNVASECSQGKMLTTDARRTDVGQKAIPKAHHEHLVLR